MENDFQKIAAGCFICRAKSACLFFKKNNFNLWKCRNCGLIFVYPRGNYKEIYGADYFFQAKDGFGYVDYDKDKEPMTATFKKYLGIIGCLTAKRGKLLDVGAATGFFIKLARAAGWEASGVEIANDAAALGRKNGLEIITGSLGELKAPAESFAVITMFDVLEHFSDPQKEITLAGKLLQKDGLLVINTPDAGSFFAKILGRHWHLFTPPEHLFYFNKNNLEKFLEAAGFAPLVFAKIGKSFSLEYIFKTLYRWQKLFLWKCLSDWTSKSFLVKIAWPVNLRDNFFMVAKKK